MNVDSLTELPELIPVETTITIDPCIEVDSPKHTQMLLDKDKYHNQLIEQLFPEDKTNSKGKPWYSSDYAKYAMIGVALICLSGVIYYCYFTPNNNNNPEPNPQPTYVERFNMSLIGV
uniref:hypothetical protein n=1 Tax=Peniophora lycii TaxID=154539 RepID=UPI001BEFF664|nr:hypothetical protein MFQ47_mgp10 [Peniophora lycii]QUA00867.1 hypothetical protein [Peniophora lycii]